MTNRKMLSILALLLVCLLPWTAMAESGEGLDFSDDNGWVNFLGNILAFLPLGVFLPLLFRRQRNFWISSLDSSKTNLKRERKNKQCIAFIQIRIRM